MPHWGVLDLPRYNALGCYVSLQHTLVILYPAEKPLGFALAYVSLEFLLHFSLRFQLQVHMNRTWSLPASVSLCLSCLPPSPLSRTFCQLWMNMTLSIYQPHTVPLGPLHCFPLEASSETPPVTVLDSRYTFLFSLSASFPDQKSHTWKPSLSPNHGTEGSTVELWIPQHPQEVGDVHLTYRCRGHPQPPGKEQCSKRRTKGSDRRPVLCFPLES